jgi:hypothetical protein
VDSPGVSGAAALGGALRCWRQASNARVGTDDRRTEPEIIAAVLPRIVLIIHVMRTAMRNSRVRTKMVRI